MDKRNEIPFEVIRCKIQNSGIGFGGLGVLHRSPDDRWLIFARDGWRSQIIIIRRDVTTSPRFADGNDLEVVEKYY